MTESDELFGSNVNKGVWTGFEDPAGRIDSIRSSQSDNDFIEIHEKVYLCLHGARRK